MNINAIGIWVLYKKETRRFIKVLMQTMVAPMVTTLLFLTVFQVALHHNDTPVLIGNLTFPQFLAPGLIMMAILQNAFANSSSSLIISKMNGCLVDILLAPISTIGYLFAMATSAMTRGVLVGFSVAVAMLLFVPIGVHDPVALIFYTCIGGLFMGLSGVLTGIWAEKFDHVATITNFVVSPLSFLSGTFYSVDNLDPAWRWLIDFNPIFYMIDGMRYAMTGHHDGDLQLGLLVISGVTILMSVLCYRAWENGYRVKN